MCVRDWVSETVCARAAQVCGRDAADARVARALRAVGAAGAGAGGAAAQTRGRPRRRRARRRRALHAAAGATERERVWGRDSVREVGESGGFLSYFEWMRKCVRARVHARVCECETKREETVRWYRPGLCCL
eukprot:2104003-Pleurochrysis_carterae.AAC.1